MLILSLECAGYGCGVCVWRDGAVLALREERMERGQDARLVLLVQEVMAQVGSGFPDLDRMAVTRGPGSFTGLRIGLAAARGFGLAAGKPVVGIDRFAIHRHQQKVSALLVVLESRRLELYTRFYSAQDSAQEAALLSPDEIAVFARQRPDLKIVGDAPDKLRGLLSEDVFLSQAEPEVLTCAALAARVDAQDSSFAPRPLYLRAPDVTIKPCGLCHEDSCG